MCRRATTLRCQQLEAVEKLNNPYTMMYPSTWKTHIDNRVYLLTQDMNVSLSVNSRHLETRVQDEQRVRTSLFNTMFISLQTQHFCLFRVVELKCYNG